MWEYFIDECYYGTYAIRHTDNKSFSSAIHVQTKEEAEFICEKLNELQILKKTNSDKGSSDVKVFFVDEDKVMVDGKMYYEKAPQICGTQKSNIEKLCPFKKITEKFNSGYLENFTNCIKSNCSAWNGSDCVLCSDKIVYNTETEIVRR